ncbi:NLGN [Mytilus coruscus]|uniref:NLGN n=1 Tax=Mytilus coruscus TaxID=42192 RepID=A0A6J8D965_MYTCO|nr:NLGN [Mytilus coruscus]
MKHIFFDFVILVVLFNNIQAEVCTPYGSWLKYECYDIPCTNNWYAMCNECCKMNSTWYCVPDVRYRTCEATGQGSVTTTTTQRPIGGFTSTTKRYSTDRPYPTHKPNDNTDNYSSNSRTAAVTIAVGASVLLEQRALLRKSDHIRRNVPITAPNLLIAGNSGQARGNPIYYVGERGTTIVPNSPHGYTNEEFCQHHLTLQYILQKFNINENAEYSQASHLRVP